MQTGLQEVKLIRSVVNQGGEEESFEATHTHLHSGPPTGLGKEEGKVIRWALQTAVWEWGSYGDESASSFP